MHFPNLQPWFDKLDSLLPTIPLALAVAGFFLPIALGLFSRRTLVFLGCVLIAAIALSILLYPKSIVSIVVIGAYFGSLLLAMFGIQMSRKASAVRTELMGVRAELDEMRSVLERRYLAELKRDRRKKKNEDKDKVSEPLP